MTSEAVKLKRLELKAAQLAALQDAGSVLLRNPVIEVLGGYALTEYLYRHPKDRPIIGDITSLIALRATLASVIGYQQIAPLLPQLGEAVKSLLPLTPK